MIAGLAGWGESGKTCGGSGDGGKKSDPPVQIIPEENKPASPTNVMTKDCVCLCVFVCVFVCV